MNKNNTLIKNNVNKQSKDGIKKPNEKYYSHADSISKESGIEIKEGLKILSKIKNKIVTVFGSHSMTRNNSYYKDCEKVAYQLGKRGYAIITGGGPGIMEAANSGAIKAGTESIGFKAKLLQAEQSVDGKLFTHQYSYKYLFARRFNLAIESEALIFYPGGYGTLNELFEYITLIQTHMVDAVPIICVGRKYWAGLFKWMADESVKEGVLGKKDLEIINFADNIDQILGIIEKKF